MLNVNHEPKLYADQRQVSENTALATFLIVFAMMVVLAFVYGVYAEIHQEQAARQVVHSTVLAPDATSGY